MWIAPLLLVLGAGLELELTGGGRWSTNLIDRRRVDGFALLTLGLSEEPDPQVEPPPRAERRRQRRCEALALVTPASALGAAAARARRRALGCGGAP